MPPWPDAIQVEETPSQLAFNPDATRLAVSGRSWVRVMAPDGGVTLADGTPGPAFGLRFEGDRLLLAPYVLAVPTVSWDQTVWEKLRAAWPEGWSGNGEIVDAA